ncbi:MAG: siphovirus Gp157 family protein (plasmid) [Dolichospermum sp. DET50]|nr:siphovirus Gp157 family protein [Dolichospermum sp. DET66]MBS3035882.1 siphovirus Gp157 family protein [Dolichospermum sp. DET67]MBS3041203.1 siphovirus Gp157 family protein [Dolichospermum sp. DET50]QSX70938.1 MAG: siphovirus Gp157 family protein [Dolichospermum sp. DET69]
MVLSLAQQSLAGLSQTAAHLWEQLTNCQTTEEESAIITAIWETQEVQSEAIDIQAELALQLDAEIAAVKQRLEHLKAVHQSALLRLERWRQKLDETILEQNAIGILPEQMIGNSLRITIKENPPSCDVVVDAEKLPPKYRREKTVYSADKKAIIAAWKKGIPVDGTRVERKQRVVYALTATAIQDFKDSLLP